MCLEVFLFFSVDLLSILKYSILFGKAEDNVCRREVKIENTMD